MNHEDRLESLYQVIDYYQEKISTIKNGDDVRFNSICGLESKLYDYLNVDRGDIDSIIEMIEESDRILERQKNIDNILE